MIYKRNFITNVRDARQAQPQNLSAVMPSRTWVSCPPDAVKADIGTVMYQPQPPKCHRRYHPDCSDMFDRAFHWSGRSVDRFDRTDVLVISSKCQLTTTSRLYNLHLTTPHH